MITKKQLAIKLSKLKKIDNLKVKLEQYPTDSEIASEILWNAYLSNKIENKVIADLGCGNGIFAYGSLLLGAKKVFCMDLDQESLDIAKENIENKKAVFLNIDIKEFNEEVDTVFQNPPFGTKVKHIDLIFLKKALQIADSVYTLHKSTTADFIRKNINKFEIKEELTFNFPIKHSYKFHNKPVKQIRVTCFILDKKTQPLKNNQK